MSNNTKSLFILHSGIVLLIISMCILFVAIALFLASRKPSNYNPDNKEKKLNVAQKTLAAKIIEAPAAEPGIRSHS